MLLNFTPKISEMDLLEFKESNPNIKFIRCISNYTDANDDGLRMNFPLANKIKIQKKKKKNK